MILLQINTVNDCGSTGTIVSNIATAVEAQGHSCFVAYGQRKSSYHRSYRIGSILENHIHNICSRLFGNQGYYTYRGTKQLIQYIKKIRPDIIHLHNLHGNYLNLPLLFDFLSENRIPVVLTIHDCWIFTGKCVHYTEAQCFKWKTGCCHCPQYKNYPPAYFFDRSKQLYADKKRWLGSLLNLQVIAVSKWLQQEVEMSFLGQHFVHQIYNWVDADVFHRLTDAEFDYIFGKYHLPRQYKYLVSVGTRWSANSSKMQDAKLLAQQLPVEYKLILVGSVARGTRIPSNMFHIPYTSATELSAIYSLAAGYIQLSVEDTFGKVIAEAMACGTIPIVFDSTACPEIVGPYGYVVKPHDVKAVVELLPCLNASIEARKRIADYVKIRYNQKNNVQSHIDLYNSLVCKVSLPANQI